MWLDTFVRSDMYYLIFQLQLNTRAPSHALFPIPPGVSLPKTAHSRTQKGPNLFIFIYELGPGYKSPLAPLQRPTQAKAYRIIKYLCVCPMSFIDLFEINKRCDLNRVCLMDDIFGSHYMEIVNMCVLCVAAACYFVSIFRPFNIRGSGFIAYVNMECRLTNCCGHLEYPTEREDDQFDFDFDF